MTLGFFSVYISCWKSSECYKIYFGDPRLIELVDWFWEVVRLTELIEVYLLNGHNPPDLGLRRIFQSCVSVALCAAHLITHQIKYCISYQHSLNLYKLKAKDPLSLPIKKLNGHLLALWVRYIQIRIEPLY